MLARSTFILSLLVCNSTLAAGLKLTEADLSVVAKVIDAQAMSEVRAMYARDPQAKAEAKGLVAKTLAELGWTQERYSPVASEVEEVLGILDNIEHGEAEYRADYQRQLTEEHDSRTVALVKAHSDELDSGKARERAEQKMKEERQLAATGRPVTQDAIQGTWVFDLEASLAHVSATMGLPAESLGPMRAALEKSKGTSYTFKGNTIEVKGTQNEKSTYRIEGKDLVIIDGKREHKIQIGLKAPDQLVFSMMGVGTIYKRK